MIKDLLSIVTIAANDGLRVTKPKTIRSSAPSRSVVAHVTKAGYPPLGDRSIQGDHKVFTVKVGSNNFRRLECKRIIDRPSGDDRSCKHVKALTGLKEFRPNA